MCNIMMQKGTWLDLAVLYVFFAYIIEDFSHRIKYLELQGQK